MWFGYNISVKFNPKFYTAITCALTFRRIRRQASQVSVCEVAIVFMEYLRTPYQIQLNCNFIVIIWESCVIMDGNLVQVTLFEFKKD